MLVPFEFFLNMVDHLEYFREKYQVFHFLFMPENSLVFADLLSFYLLQNFPFVHQKQFLLIIILLNLSFLVLGLLFVVKLQIGVVENILTFFAFSYLTFQFFLVLHLHVIRVIFGDYGVFFHHYLVFLLFLEQRRRVGICGNIGLEFHLQHAPFYGAEAHVGEICFKLFLSVCYENNPWFVGN